MEQQLIIYTEDAEEKELLSKNYSKEYKITFIEDDRGIVEMCSDITPTVMLLHIKSPDRDLFGNLIHAVHLQDYEIPVIVMIEENQLDFERFAREKGIFYYLIKPYKSEELAEALDSAMNVAHEKNLEAQILALKMKLLTSMHL